MILGKFLDMSWCKIELGIWGFGKYVANFLGVIFFIEATFGYNHYDGIFPILVGIVML